MITLYILAQSAHDSLLDALHHLGWWPISIADIIKVFLLLCVLFAGPLFENGIVDGDWRDWIVGRHVNETFSSWIGWRNFVAVSVSTILEKPRSQQTQFQMRRSHHERIRHSPTKKNYSNAN